MISAIPAEALSSLFEAGCEADGMQTGVYHSRLKKLILKPQNALDNVAQTEK